MGFQVNYDNNKFRQHLEGQVATALEVFKLTKRMAKLNQREAGTIVLGFLTHDREVDLFATHCGESGETALCDYWYAKALACAMTGQMRKGEEYWEKARKRRTGGTLWEWCQTFYKSG